MTTPTLKTERIILRPLKLSDAKEVFKNWATNPNVAKYMRWNTHQSIDETIEFLTSVEERINDDKNYDWGFTLKETGELIGSGGAYYNDNEGMFEIGYCIMEEQWNKGLTTEAAKAMVDFVINKLQQTEVYANCAWENINSGKILEKLGFAYTGDGEYKSFDEKRTFKSRNYHLTK